MHRVSSPWLKLLSAVGVIPTLMMMRRGKSSAQHSRSDNQTPCNQVLQDTYAVHTRPRSLEETLERRRDRGAGVCTRVIVASWSCFSVVGRGRSSLVRSTPKKDHDKHDVETALSYTYAVHTTARRRRRRARGHPRKSAVLALLACCVPHERNAQEEPAQNNHVIVQTYAVSPLP